MRISHSIRFDSWEFGQSARQGGGSMTAESPLNGSELADESTAGLVNRASSQMMTLVRDEITLARIELTAKAKRAGVGGGLLGAAAILSLYGLGLIIALAIVALDLVWPLWLAVLIVAVGVFAAAGLAALGGKHQLRHATPPIPTDATANVAADVHTVKTAIQDGRRS
jgi:uncharacterized membrane protein YqjE